MEKIDVFPTRIFVFRNAEYETLNTNLLTDIAEARHLSPGLQKSTQGGWHSDKSFLSSSVSASQLRDYFLRSASTVLHQMGRPHHPELDAKGWVSLLDTNGYNVPHCHPGALLSGAYYVDTGDSGMDHGGQISFFDPRGIAEMAAFPNAFSDEGKNFVYQPKAGELLLFPGWLKHWVLPYTGKRPRIAVAANVYPAKGMFSATRRRVDQSPNL